MKKIDISKLNKTFFKKHQVVLAYVFGSFVNGIITPLSDLDIAVVFDKKVSNDEHFDRCLSLSSAISLITKIDRVDVVDLEVARNPLLKHDAVLGGKVLFSGNSEIQRKLELRILQEYEDTELLRKTQYYYLKKHIKDGSFGKAILSPKKAKIIEKYVN